jgi:hypothetical protein
LHSPAIFAAACDSGMGEVPVRGVQGRCAGMTDGVAFFVVFVAAIFMVTPHTSFRFQDGRR